MRYLFVVKSERDPATRYRVWPLQDKLQVRGHEVKLISASSGLLRLLKEVQRADITVIQRKLFTRPIVRVIRLFAKKLVYDFDDAIFLKSDGRNSSNRMKRFRTIVSLADQVWAGNNYLQENAKEYRRTCKDKVFLVPTSVDTIGYNIDVEKEDVFTLVWIGSSSTRKYLEMYRDCLEELGRKFPDIKLKVISDFQWSLKSMSVDNVSWSQATEIAGIKSSHVGIAPMEDNPWTRGKCALKVLQYMAASIPVISSDVGTNKEVVIDGLNGYLVRDTNDWVRSLGLLIESEAHRIQMGKMGRERVDLLFSSRVVVENALHLLEKL